MKRFWVVVTKWRKAAARDVLSFVGAGFVDAPDLELAALRVFRGHGLDEGGVRDSSHDFGDGRWYEGYKDWEEWGVIYVTSAQGLLRVLASLLSVPTSRVLTDKPYPHLGSLSDEDILGFVVDSLGDERATDEG